MNYFINFKLAQVTYAYRMWQLHEWTMYHGIYIKKDHETISSEQQVNLNELCGK